MVKRSVQKSEERKLPLVEEFYSIQGEGYHSGKAAYFIRLGGCDIGCSWCDTPYSWDPALHPMTDADDIVEHVIDSGTDSVVVTGGEPLMWDLGYLCLQLKKKKILTYLETSGAYPLTGEWDWICLSPKKNMPPVTAICNCADELKVIIEDKSDLERAERFRRKVSKQCRLFLQPEWSRFKAVIPEIVDYVRHNNEWRISLQIHKYMHIQ
jgi:7-carboxy-7-deazaguanine synthase